MFTIRFRYFPQTDSTFPNLDSFRVCSYSRKRDTLSRNPRANRRLKALPNLTRKDRQEHGLLSAPNVQKPRSCLEGVAKASNITETVGVFILWFQAYSWIKDIGLSWLFQYRILYLASLAFDVRVGAAGSDHEHPPPS